MDYLLPFVPQHVLSHSKTDLLATRSVEDLKPVGTQPMRILPVLPAA